MLDIFYVYILSPNFDVGGKIAVWPVELPKFLESAVEGLKPLLVIDLGRNRGY